ncbi:CD4-1 molecule isoform X2 [Alosa pseudoharengus]|uniref:CD4-1 molecule isoform X2 n=1 Tax=Alosa pseudoharengus TaxID=34774 RepID=UPI003F888E62
MSWPSNRLTEIHIFGSRSTSIRGDKMYAVWVAALLLMTTISPIWADRPMVVYAQQGGSIQLPTKEKAKTGSYMTWYFGIQENNITVEVYNKHGLGQISTNNNWKDRISVSDKDDSLIISKVTASDFGFFRYEQKERQSTTVNIVYKLCKVTLTPPLTVLYGEPLTLNCKMEEKSKFTKITWIPPETVDDTRRKLCTISTSPNLQITNLSWRDKGVWTCSVIYNGTTTKATTTIHVVDLLPTPSEPIYTSTASSLGLPCSISSPVGWGEVLGKGLQKGGWTFLPAALRSGEPGQIASLSLNSTPRWDIMPNRMDGSALEKGHKGNDLSLRMKVVTVADRGNYTCALNFQKVKLERTVRVEVLQVVASPSPRAFEGQQLNLTCTLGYSLDPESELEVKWTPPKAVSLPALASTPHPHTLSVEASVGHSGRWKCELRKRNETLTSADVSLKIEKLPVDVWLCVGIASTGLIVILLIFIASALINRRRQRTQRRKTRFCCCKNPKPQKGFYRT